MISETSSSINNIRRGIDNVHINNTRRGIDNVHINNIRRGIDNVHVTTRTELHKPYLNLSVN